MNNLSTILTLTAGRSKMFGVILSSKMSSFHPSIWLSFSSPFLSPLLFIHLLLLFFHLILLLVLSCPFSASAQFSWLFSWKISHMIVKRWRFFTALVVWLEDDSWFFGTCSLLLYGTGICYYGLIKYFFVCFIVVSLHSFFTLLLLLLFLFCLFCFCLFFIFLYFSWTSYW